MFCFEKTGCPASSFVHPNRHVGCLPIEERCETCRSHSVRALLGRSNPSVGLPHHKYEQNWSLGRPLPLRGMKTEKAVSSVSSKQKNYIRIPKR